MRKEKSLKREKGDDTSTSFSNSLVLKNDLKCKKLLSKYHNKIQIIITLKIKNKTRELQSLELFMNSPYFLFNDFINYIFFESLYSTTLNANITTKKVSESLGFCYFIQSLLNYQINEDDIEKIVLYKHQTSNKNDKAITIKNYSVLNKEKGKNKSNCESNNQDIQENEQDNLLKNISTTNNTLFNSNNEYLNSKNNYYPVISETPSSSKQFPLWQTRKESESLNANNLISLNSKKDEIVNKQVNSKTKNSKTGKKYSDMIQEESSLYTYETICYDDIKNIKLWNVYINGKIINLNQCIDYERILTNKDIIEFSYENIIID